MDKIINLTGHDINIMCPDGSMITIPSDGMLRSRYTTNHLPDMVTNYGNIPITQNHYHRIRSMPQELPNTFYIVSRLVAELYPERNDLLMVNGLIKQSGKTIGCRSLAKTV